MNGYCFQIIIVSAGIWAMGGMQSSFIRKPVPHWSNPDVLEWLGGLGESVQKDTHDIFKREVRRSCLNKC